MELERTGSPKQTVPKSTGEENKVSSSSELLLDYELPDLLEFSSFDEILLLDKPSEGSDTCFHSNRQESAPNQQQQQQRPTIFANYDEEIFDDFDLEEDPKRFQFICKVCEKSFGTIRACEKHIIKSGHTYPLIALRSSDNMNGEVFDNLVVSLEERGTYNSSSSKSVPSPNFSPIYMGKWSKVICELRHRFGQEPEYENGILYKDYLHHNHHPVERYSQPDVTQTEPKAPHAEIASTMKKLNECFQTTRSIPETTELSTNGFENTQQIDEPHNERQIDDEIDGLFEASGKEANDNIHDLPSENEQRQEAEIVPSDSNALDNRILRSGDVGDLNNSVKHKIYVDFLANKLLCEGCGTTFLTLNDAANHWRSAKPNDIPESTSDVVDSAIGFTKESDVVACESCDLPTKTDQGSVQTLRKTANAGGDEESKENETETGETPAENNDGETTENKSDEVFGDVCDNTSDKTFGFLTPFDDKRNGGNTLYGICEKELLIKDETRWSKNKKGFKGQKKRKKNKPLKYIRRAFMLTLTFLF